MKRITTLFLATALFLGASNGIFHGTSQAAEFKINGQYTISGQVVDSINLLNSIGSTLTGSTSPDNLQVYQRMQVGIDMITSENLSGTFVMRAPNKSAWGQDDFSIGDDTSSVDIHRAYIDWIFPDTNFSMRIGLQDYTLPGYLGGAANPIVDSTATGITLKFPIGNYLDITAQWFRLEASETASSSNYDVFNLIVPLAYKDFTIVPWATYGVQGKSSENNTTGVETEAYWFGVTTKFDLIEAITFGVEGIFSTKNTNYTSHENATGWLVDAYLSYNTAYGTPALFGWYASGDDHKNGKRYENQLATIEGQGSWGYGNWIAGASSYFVQDKTLLLSTAGASTPAGTWAIGLGYSDYQLMDRIRIGGHALFIGGTNNKRNGVDSGETYSADYLTTEDNLIELAVYSVVNIYQELQAALLFNYTIENIDKTVWLTDAQRAAGADFENSFRVALSLQYTF